jgi:o-succinylbenzoate synthase
MLRASYKKHNLIFKNPGKTSRGTLHEKETYILKVWDENRPEIEGIGECALFKGLSYDDKPEYEHVLAYTCKEINKYDKLLHELSEFPSIKIGVETAIKDLQNGGKRIIYENEFSQGKEGIIINGLIWMSDIDSMLAQIEAKLENGFSCIKLKIGALDIEKELRLIERIRKNHSENELQIRVDANGAFTPTQADDILKELKKLSVHSIEQPIKKGQTDAMHKLCKETPVPIALDEELIGVHTFNEKKKLLEDIQPHYIILKPSLLGGFTAAEEWIKLANDLKMGWWVTSALESNIGLNAIAQWTASLNTSMPQGLGTGQLFQNNFDSPLSIRGEKLFYDISKSWEGISI